EYRLETYQGKACIWLKDGKASLPEVRFRGGTLLRSANEHHRREWAQKFAPRGYEQKTSR
ncbi:MAG: hypothetical protein AAGM67_05715, partial [Bacteroidota bacterium]